MSGKSACPVLRGAGVQPEYGRDTVAPPRKQAANREHKRRPVALGDSCLLEGKSASELPSLLRRSKNAPKKAPSGRLATRNRLFFEVPPLLPLVVRLLLQRSSGEQTWTHPTQTDGGETRTGGGASV